VRSSGECLGIVNSLWEVVEARREDLRYIKGED
jgi:hypothetical protein